MNPEQGVFNPVVWDHDSDGQLLREDGEEEGEKEEEEEWCPSMNGWGRQKGTSLPGARLHEYTSPGTVLS